MSSPQFLWSYDEMALKLAEAEAKAARLEAERDAAPDMLSALKEVLDAWEATAAVIAQDDRVEDLEFGAFMRVRSAIAKAEGRL